ncbi:hypothetical protein A1O7_00025 [Cladophialophora yegresii CBS 114405]|uniref:BD-FAE-like domain-containing protein n=1 Tax=Cladophialophora yegresii CBS 114405 TaxID=1182544 RepID=W9WFB9_9EURO|nr:uncharacterized protein A1O7_00025 [Cladophialophora yegresii CBS 114405]EXJ63690.1 hypothetical protein A1O7_00025 [Cladophialophora yegresii CBS 114405]
MEQLPGFGTAINEVVLPTYKLYTPLLLKQADAIKATQRESFPYGKHPRQQLDLYTPVGTPASQNKLVIFLYGGGLVRGDKINPAFPGGLVYANLGHFFAERLGCKVVIPDYRLIGHEARFPSGGEDLELVIQFIQENIRHDSSEPLNLHTIGNSAGGVHLASYLFAPQFAESRRKTSGRDAANVRLSSVTFLAVPFHFDQAVAERAETLAAYYGTNVQHHSPLGLLRAAKEDGSINDLKEVSVQVLTGSLDPENEVLVPKDDFVREWRGAKAVSENLSEGKLEGHNHISPVLSLGTGIRAEEAWAEQVLDFINKAVPSH